MDDSDQDFVDLCSKLLKRVRRKPGESRPPRNAHQPPSQAGEGDRRRRNNTKDGDCGSKVTGTQSVCTTRAGQRVVSGGTEHASGEAVAPAAAGSRAERGLTAKDKVLLRMHQFKRASPQRMVHRDTSRPTHREVDAGPQPLPHRQDPPEPCSSAVQPDSDEALALRLQRQLDREAAASGTVHLEDGGLFFCQICHRDLSHMTPEGRTQHLNRCLDESEGSAPPPPPPPPGVPECPICGKKFKSQKSRSTHLKRCSSDMGVAPAVLLQVLQRQAEETQIVSTANTVHRQTGGTKRKGPSKPGLPARKKPRKKTAPLDEDTMVALALSSSLLVQESAASHTSMTPTLMWRPDAAKGRAKKKKGAAPRPPPLLLVQDAQAALVRLQERVSALLLRNRAPSPPTPTRCPSSLRGCSSAAPLWQKSTLLSGSSTHLSDFYTQELSEFITPWETPKTDAASSNAGNKPESSLRPISGGTPVAGTTASVPPPSSQTAASSSSSAPSTPGTGQLPVGSQALWDLMELAEDGMTLTQCGYTTSGPDKNKQSSASQSANLHLSGFVLQEAEEQADPCVSGFLPETAHTSSEDTQSRARGKTHQPGEDKERGSQRSAALTRLASDLSSMVNNPQLSDLQLQVDSGEVYFAHSFMVYARCPLLAEMVHESGIGVQERDAPAAKRVLMSDVPGQAVFALLQYLYTARCTVPASLRPHVVELSSRFDLQELQRLCELHQEEAPTQGDEADATNQDGSVNDKTDHAFMELLRSMWNEDDEEDEGTDTDGGHNDERGTEEDRQTDDAASGEREVCEEQVNEEELEEIYEFAATQRKREEDEEDSVEEEKVHGGEEVLTKLAEAERDVGDKTLKPNPRLEPDPRLDLSYSRLFSDSLGVYEDKETCSSSSPSPYGTPQKHQSSHKPSCELSGRTLLQSSPSMLDEFSPSPPPSTSNRPIPGLSPGQVGGGGDKGTDAVELSLKRESRGICVLLSPDSRPKKKEPELIVLSDSSEEMEVDVAVLNPCSPSPHSPFADQNLQSYTHIKDQLVPKPTEHSMENKVSSSLQLSPSGPSAALVQSPTGSGCDQSPVDCSLEVSWLIPSTPVQHRRASGHTGPTEGSVPRLELDETAPCSSSLDVNSSPKRTGSYDGGKNREHQPKLSDVSSSTHRHPLLASLKHDTPHHVQPQPCSSTPLHTDIQQPPAPTASPFIRDLDKQKLTSKGSNRASSESPERTELGSFHLSPSPNPLEPPSSSSHRSLHSSQKQNQSSGESRRSVESSRHESTGAELKRAGLMNEEGENKDACNEGEQEYANEESGEAEAAESSFRQSFMDEPPIAFNDSWGFDACVEANPGRFSLRLEDSGGSSQLEHSPGRRGTTSIDRHPQSSSHCMQSSSPSKALSEQPTTSVQACRSSSFTPSPPDPNNSLLATNVWDSWQEEEEEPPPLSQRMNPSAQLRTPASSHNKKRRSLVPITPMPHYSDMDTPDLKNKLNRFGVRPLPKRQMILKLKEIHQYTHQLVSSDSEEETPTAGCNAQMKPPPDSRPISRTQTVRFKEPRAPSAASPQEHRGEEEEEEGERLSASQGSNTSSTAASEESERSNPELCLSSDGDSDSDGGISASQSATRLQDRLGAVRSFILSDPGLYSQILQYQPLVLSQLQERLKAAGIRLGAAKLVDYLDSQCITFTTAKRGRSAPSRRGGRRTKAAGVRGANRKKNVTVSL
ncbi:structure-specific endonuclease subunit SLX4 isoform X2 [Scophthalmus maximus]|uniref:structure-specific endonuclease subunit SLX4 isoform X2 n=1 Tax=Scophthalmus maximus TaxID=52904 RepID=UPI001FA89AC1|nr:structure-specific endonuclease subunit SLX4 isoform X2 [Scophthalmus maximus]